MKKNSHGPWPTGRPNRKNYVGVRETFRFCAHWVAAAVGSAWAFIFACLAILIWAATGPIFHYSDTWQLIINTATTIVTFLIVSLIQNTQPGHQSNPPEAGRTAARGRRRPQQPRQPGEPQR